MTKKKIVEDAGLGVPVNERVDLGGLLEVELAMIDPEELS